MVVEEGSEAAADLWETGHPAASSILSYPEGRAALAAARRAGRLTAQAHRRTLDDFESLQAELLLVGIDEALAREAGLLAEDHGLRGFDAVHLATALALGNETTLVSWDEDQRRAAIQLGCAVAPAES